MSKILIILISSILIFTGIYSISSLVESDWISDWRAEQSSPYGGGTGQARDGNNFIIDDVKCGTGTVYDRLTELCWEKNPITTSLNHAGAISRCNNLILGNARGWRLPQSIELNTLLSYDVGGYTNQRNLDTKIIGLGTNRFWSSTIKRSSSGAFSVFLGGGCSEYCYLAPTNRVLCVRGLNT